MAETTQTLIVYNANLYAIAAQYYNDATAWVLIAQASGLTDPQVISSTPLTIVIPPYDSDYNGGIWT